MIASIEGPVLAIQPDNAVIGVGGLGLTVLCTPTTIARLRVGSPARLATSLVVREDSLTLFGFADDDERELFSALQSASGIGPRIAQAALGVLAPDQLRRAIVTGDLATLCTVPGIGRKGAERIVVELRDRIGPVPVETGPAASAAASPVAEQLLQALQSLGWSTRDAEPAIAAAMAGADADADVAVLLRTALRGMQRA